MNTNKNLKSEQNHSLSCVSADMVPDEEKAVSIDWTKLTVKLDCMYEAVPKDERAEEISPEDQELMVKRAKTTYLRGMGHICGVLEDRVYALIKIDEDNKRTYVICIDQGDNMPTKIEIEQALLVRLVKAKFNVTMLERAGGKKLIEKLLEIENHYFNTWESGNLPFDLVDVLNAVNFSKGDLPIKRIMAPDERHDFYDQLKTVLEQYSSCCFEKKSYYAIIPEYVKDIAKDMKMSERSLIKKLNDFDLLYKQASSVGYQSKVRVFDNPEWMLCVYKLEYFEELQEKSLKSTNADDTL